MNADGEPQPKRARRVLRTTAERSALIRDYETSGLIKMAMLLRLRHIDPAFTGSILAGIEEELVLVVEGGQALVNHQDQPVMVAWVVGPSFQG